MIASRRLRNSGVNSFSIAAIVLAFALAAAKADGFLRGVRAAGVRGHDQDDIAEIDFLPLASVSCRGP
jgi:hypothetical protein